ncbi:MAG: hypothetical protein AAGJ93_07275, partial [Bacteroidota bacterium]
MKSKIFLCCISSILLFLCLTPNAQAQIDRILPEVQSYQWSEGWTTVRFFNINDRPFAFLGKAGELPGSGYTAKIHPVKVDGRLGAPVYQKRWSAGWTSVEFYQVRGRTFMMRLKERGNGHSYQSSH